MDSGSRAGPTGAGCCREPLKSDRVQRTQAVRAVDVSPDGTKIATGSEDCTACVWSLSTGRRLLGPFKHNWCLAAAKFSPDGCLIATATWGHISGCVRVYDSQNGRLLVEFSVQPNSFLNQSLAWASDSKHLLVLSYDSKIHCLDVSSGRSRWSIESGLWDPECIALASNGTFIAVSAKSSVSLWDTATHMKIKCDICHTTDISSVVISSNYDLVTAGGKKITVHDLRDVLPSALCDNVSAFASNVPA
jgi:WD40 repeat protein